MIRHKSNGRFCLVLPALAAMALGAGCQKEEAANTAKEANTTGRRLQPIPPDPVDQFPGTAVTPAELAQPLGTINKDDFESTDQYRARLRQLDQSFGEKAPLKTVMPTEGHRWQYDADQQQISYNFDAVASLEASSALIMKGMNIPQLWLLATDVGPTRSTRFLLATQSCPVRFSATPDVAKSFRRAGTKARMVLRHRIPSYADAILDDVNKTINAAWEHDVWNEVFLRTQLQQVDVLDPSGQPMATVKCKN